MGNLRTKKAWMSKTNLLGVLQLIFGMLSMCAEDPFVSQYPHVVSGLVAVSGVLTIVLRFLTTTKIEW